MPANLPLELRHEFRLPHMRGTAIELRNRQGTGWTQRDPAELLQITYPTTDVQRAVGSIATGAQGRPLVFLGQRGRGKSHIMALLHHAIESPARVCAWAQDWGAKPGFGQLGKLVLPQGFVAITETLSNQEYRTLWDFIFDRHPRGSYYRGKHEASGTAIPAKSLIQDLFAERPTALILDEFQTWFDGLHDDPGNTGPKRRQWAFNFVQILSELAKERPDLIMLIVSVRDTGTEGYRQIHRIGPVVIDFKSETAKEDRNPTLLSIWRVEVHGTNGYFRQDVVPLAVDSAGHRLPTGEVLLNGLRDLRPASDSGFDSQPPNELIESVLPGMIRREVEHRGLLREGASLAMQLIGWIEIS